MLSKLLVPAPDNLLTMHEVSPEVNNVRKKDASLVEPHESVAQGTLLESPTAAPD
jgi:putative SOS response-associated peptidase YedK